MSAENYIRISQDRESKYWKAQECSGSTGTPYFNISLMSQTREDAIEVAQSHMDEEEIEYELKFE